MTVPRLQRAGLSESVYVPPLHAFGQCAAWHLLHHRRRVERKAARWRRNGMQRARLAERLL